MSSSRYDNSIKHLRNAESYLRNCKALYPEHINTLYQIGHKYKPFKIMKFFVQKSNTKSMVVNCYPVAERSKARVCSRSPAEIAGSNPAGGMEICLL